MATAGSVVVDLLMKTGSFETDSARAEKRLDQMHKTAVKWAAGVGAAAGTAAVAFGAWAANLADNAAQIERLSKLANSSSEDFQRWAYAAGTVGIEQDKLADILKDVQDRVGDFLNTGGGPMADFFEKIAPQVGVTAEQFRQLSGQKGLGLYVDTLEKVGLSQSEMIFYLEAMASDSSLLLPLLRNGAAGIRSLSDEADRFGLVMNTGVINSAADLDRNIERLKAQFKGISVELGGKVLPVMNEFISQAFKTSDEVRGLARDVAQLSGNKDLPAWINVVGYGLATVADSVIGVIMAMNAAKHSFGAVIADSKAAVASFNFSAGALNPFSNAGERATEAKKLAETLAERNRTVADANEALANLWNYKGDANVRAWENAVAKYNFGNGFVGPPEPEGPGTTGSDGSGDEISRRKKLLEQQAILDRYRTKAQMMTAELEKAREAFGGLVPPELEQRIRESFAETGKEVSRQVDVGQMYIGQMRERLALIGKETEQERLLAQISVGSAKFRTPEMEKQALALAEQIDLVQKQYDTQRMLKDLEESRFMTQIQFSRELASLGQGDRVRELNSGLAAVEDRYRSLIAQRQAVRGGLTDNELAQLMASMNAELEMVREYHSKKLAIQQNWSVGAIDAVRNYVNETNDLYQHASDFISSTFGGMEEAFVSFSQTGKLSFSGLVDSMIADLVRLTVRQNVTGPLAGWLMSGVGGLFGDGAVTGARLPGIGGTAGGLLDDIVFLPGKSEGGYTGDGGKYEPAGIVHRGEYVLSKEAVDRLDIGFLDRLNRGYASGGLVGGSSLPAFEPHESGMRVVVENHGVDIQVRQDRENQMRIIAREEASVVAPRAVANDMRRPNSWTSKAVGDSFNTTRKR